MSAGDVPRETSDLTAGLATALHGQPLLTRLEREAFAIGYAAGWRDRAARYERLADRVPPDQDDPLRAVLDYVDDLWRRYPPRAES